jgi:integrase
MVERSSADIFSQIEREDPNFDRKLDLITAGANPFLKEHLLTKVTRENCLTIINYVLAMQTETEVSEHYRINTVLNLKKLAEFYKTKSFSKMTRQDIVEYLDRLRKPESVDPLHQWIGTYELTRVTLLRFFKWLHCPNRNEVSPRNRPTPDVMLNIPQIKRREISIYKPTDLWTEEDDMLFYKYCPSLRDKCWHAVSRDTGCRVSEMLKIKIKDIVVQPLENGYQIAKIRVSGKTGVRNVRLNNAYPRVKDWLSNGHPYQAYPNSPLFCGLGRKNIGRSISRHTIHAVYAKYKKVHFPKLLKDPLVPEDDKRKICDLLQKPWNPYLRRHTAATEVFKAVKDPKIVNQYFGWSENSIMYRRYSHYFADDSIDAILTVVDGLKPSSRSSLASSSSNKDLLRPKLCPNCNESNKPESKFCAKCKFVLSFDAFNEAVEEKSKAAKEAEETKKRLEELAAKQEILQANSASVLRALMAAEVGVKPQVEIITYNAKDGREGLFAAAEMARAENQKRQREHQQRHNELDEWVRRNHNKRE